MTPSKYSNITYFPYSPAHGCINAIADEFQKREKFSSRTTAVAKSFFFVQIYQFSLIARFLWNKLNLS